MNNTYPIFISISSCLLPRLLLREIALESLLKVLTSAGCRWGPFRGIVGRGCSFPHACRLNPSVSSFSSEKDNGTKSNNGVVMDEWDLRVRTTEVKLKELSRQMTLSRNFRKRGEKREKNWTRGMFEDSNSLSPFNTAFSLVWGTRFRGLRRGSYVYFPIFFFAH